MRRIAPPFLAITFAITAVSPPAHGQVGTPADSIDERTQAATGLYFTGPYIEGRGAEGIIDLLRLSRMDTAVIDLRDATGRVHHDTAIAELEPQESGMFGDGPAFMRALRDAGVHTVARIVCFNDPVFAAAHADRAIIDSRERFHGRIWTSWGTGGPWLDPWDAENQAQVLALAEEAEALGFDEVQLDYIRFPVDEAREWALYPDERAGVTRSELLHDLLARLDAALDVPIGVDVFGIQAFNPGDSSDLGQDLELWTDHVDVFTPMLYLHAMSDWEVGEEDRGRRLVARGVRLLRDRIGARPVIRPFLQAFEAGADHWDREFIEEQIRGARRGGADGFLFWNAGSSYGMVQRTMVREARSLSPFPIPEDRVEARSLFGG